MIIAVIQYSTWGITGNESSVDYSETESSNWLKGATRGTRYVPADITFEIEIVGQVDKKAGVRFGISGGLQAVKCCILNEDPNSWCNQSLEHHLC